jgi:energy-coupling factor transport system permease protein
MIQVVTLVLASVAASSGAGAVELAGAMSWYLAPLRLVRLPVDALALSAGIGLSLVPTMTDDIDRLRGAQLARGIDARHASLPHRLRLRSQLVAPLFVLAFRRAYVLAEALHVRGWRADRRRTTWRPQRLGVLDLLIPLCGLAVLVAAVTTL